MKKILLGTTALIGAAGLYASAASAATPTVTVGGFADFQTGFVSEDQDTNRRGWLFQNDTEVHFRVDGKADNGLGYGAVIELEADVTADADGEGFNADKTFLYLQGGWGRVELGANIGASQALQVDARNVARATGGIDGDWYDYVNLLGTGGSAPFIISPDLPVAHGAGTSAGISGAAGSSEDASKVIYYTPRWSGFQLGLSYAPDAANTGTASGFNLTNVYGFENVWQGGVNYQGKISNVTVAASLTGELGDGKTAGFEDLAAWAIGGTLGYNGFSFGASYGDWNDSGQVKGASNNDSDYWTLGLGYVTGPFGASITYLDSEYATNDLSNLSIGVDYKLAPGLVPYAEVTFFELDRAGSTNDNDGTVFLVGSQLSF